MRPQFGSAHLSERNALPFSPLITTRNNLAHCFGCERNFNNIDLLLSCEYDFRSAVAQLEAWLEQYRSERSKRWTTDPKEPPASGV